MAKIDDAVRDFVLYHSKRTAKEVVGDLPAKVRDLSRRVRTLQKTVDELARNVGQLLAAKQEEAPATLAVEEEVEKARFTRRTLPALRTRFGLTQQEAAKLLEVSALAVSAWETGRNKPRGKNLAKIVALRSMGQEEVNAALEREATPKPMTADQIRALRGRLGITQADLAKLAEVSPNSVTSWETGKKTPQGANRVALAVVAEMTVEKAAKKLGREGLGAGVEATAKGAEITPEKIREIRKKAGLSQKAFAAALGVAVNSISNWETGSTKPQRISAAKLLSMAR
jgi:DNA-binding transcriptional regulator YiaG